MNYLELLEKEYSPSQIYKVYMAGFVEPNEFFRLETLTEKVEYLGLKKTILWAITNYHPHTISFTLDKLDFIPIKYLKEFDIYAEKLYHFDLAREFRAMMAFPEVENRQNPEYIAQLDMPIEDKFIWLAENENTGLYDFLIKNARKLDIAFLEKHVHLDPYISKILSLNVYTYKKTTEYLSRYVIKHSYEETKEHAKLNNNINYKKLKMKALELHRKKNDLHSAIIFGININNPFTAQFICENADFISRERILKYARMAKVLNFMKLYFDIEEIKKN